MPGIINLVPPQLRQLAQQKLSASPKAFLEAINLAKSPIASSKNKKSLLVLATLWFVAAAQITLLSPWGPPTRITPSPLSLDSPRLFLSDCSNDSLSKLKHVFRELHTFPGGCYATLRVRPPA